MLNKEFLQNNKRHLLNIFIMIILNSYMIYTFNDVINYTLNNYDKSNTIGEWNIFNISFTTFIISSFILYVYWCGKCNILKESKILDEICNILNGILYIIIFISAIMVIYNYYVLFIYISVTLGLIYTLIRIHLYYLILLILNKKESINVLE